MREINKKFILILLICIFIILLLMKLLGFVGKPKGNVVEKDIAYGNSTLKEAGGLLLCMQKASELIGIQDNDIDKYIKFSINNEYKLQELGTDYRMIEAYYNTNGIKVDTIARYDKTKLIENLNNNKPVIVLCGNGNFTTTGKYILIYNIDSSESVRVFDPSNKEISKMYFTVDSIINNSSMALDEEIAYWAIYKE